jgi:hypothetical protein
MDVPKKRGRKSKNKDTVVEPKIPKKRGRKPKIKSPEDDIPKIPKKRGRKPKNKYSVLTTKTVIHTARNIENISIIMRLKLKQEDIDNIINPTDGNSPKPYESKRISVEYAHVDAHNSDVNKYEELDKYTLKRDDKLEDTNIIATYTPNLHITDDSYIVNNMENPSNTKRTFSSNNIVRRNLRNIMFEFIDSNKKKEWPESTNIYCNWCVHSFTTPPCAIPNRYKHGCFYLYGNFCSFNCAAAYLFNNHTESMWDQYSLLNLLYKKMVKDNNFDRIKEALPRETLKIFGGFLTIEEYRKTSLTNNINYKVVWPPMVSIIPQIEETVIDNMSVRDRQILELNSNITSSQLKELRLKREKPLINTGDSLKKYMNIKIV